jgi:transposase
VPGLGADSAQQIIAEVGPTAATFPSQKCLSSWVGACPGDDESAGVNYNHRSPKGNRPMRRLLNQAANAGGQFRSLKPAKSANNKIRPGWGMFRNHPVQLESYQYYVHNYVGKHHSY